MAKDKKTEELLKKLEEGVEAFMISDRFKDYLRTMARFTNYSINNQILIALQRPDATCCAGYRAWQTKFGRQVKKGEKAIYILAPVTVKYKETVPVKDRPDEYEEVEVKMLRFKVTAVFDQSQTEGKELPQLHIHESDGKIEHYEEILSAIIKAVDLPIEFKEIKTGALGFYVPKEHRIVIDKDLNQMDMIKVLLHEVCHSICHNKKAMEEEKKSTPRKELEAEGSAFVLFSKLGLDFDFESNGSSFDYVGVWSSRTDKKEFYESMETIRNTVDGLYKAIIKELPKELVPAVDIGEDAGSLDLEENVEQTEITAEKPEKSRHFGSRSRTKAK